ncbi:MAG: hypothetical protein HW387_1690 [Parachlamydiales bacterium]|nr:hypothetical protein [Parachlamydiales bacterium]
MTQLVEIIAPCPVLNVSNFCWAFGGDDGRRIPCDSQGHPRHYEFVALPGMLFDVVDQVASHILCVRSSIYPAGPLYIDARFTRPASTLASRILPWPSVEDMTKKMASLLGTSYLWGGNWSSGIFELFTYYPPQGVLDDETKRLWTLQGVDCSGLLFEATFGRTPRNTAQLIRFGTAVPIAGKTPRQILSLVRPMDLVVWPGHVWFVLDSQFSIESRAQFGVVRRPLMERLEETCLDRCGVDEWKEGNQFVIRRFLRSTT